MNRIFISYNNTDVAVVQTLAADLATLRHQVWFDKELTGGQAWWDLILAEIRRCDVFAFALSPASLESYPCKLERDYADHLGKPILPILVADGISPALLPPALSKKQYVDYRHHDKPAFLAVIRALDSLPPEQPPEVAPEPPPVPISYLSELKERIDTSETLSFEAQTVLVFKLKEALRQQADARDGRRLLERLRKRRDLFAVVAAEIDDALSERNGRPAPASPPARPAPEPAAAMVPQTLSVRTPPQPAPPPVPQRDVDDDPLPHDIDMETGADALVTLLRHAVKTGEGWTLTATPHRTVTITCDEQTLTAVAVFSDLAEFLESARGKLKASGWKVDLIRAAGKGLAGAAVGFSFGALLLNKSFRDSAVTNVMNRSWPVRNGDARHLRSIASELLATLKIIAPNHKAVTAQQVY
jgi:hypothetical protein